MRDGGIAAAPRGMIVLIAAALAALLGCAATTVVSPAPAGTGLATTAASSSASAPAETATGSPVATAPLASPGTGTPAPSGSADPGAQVPSGMRKEVLGFFVPSQIDYILNTTDFSVLTTIAYFGISANEHGNLHRAVRGSPDFRWAAWTGSRMTQVITRAHAAGTKVVLTVTRFGWTSSGLAATVRMLSTPENRARLARESADAVVERGVDGVNVDFEPIPLSQKANFVDFVRRLRSALDARRPALQLTVDSTGFIANYDVAGLTARGAADAIFIMAYHYSGSWSNHAGAVSPLTRSSYNVTDTVNAFLSLTTPDKIMLGLPYYGNAWPTYTQALLGRTRAGSPSYGYPGSVVYATAKGLAAAHGRLWDDVEQVPWTRWQARTCGSCPLTWWQLYYEDAESLKLKHDLVTSRGLRGTGVWTLGFGGNGPELNQELRRSFGSH